MCGVGGWVRVAVCVGVYGAGLCAWLGVADGLARVRMGWVVGRCAGVWCELGGPWTGLVCWPRSDRPRILTSIVLAAA